MSEEIMSLVRDRVKTSGKKTIVTITPDGINAGKFSRLHQQQRKLSVPYCDDQEVLAGVDVSFEPSVSFVSFWVSMFNERGRKFVESKVI